MTRLSVFSSPLLLGFDELERMLDRASKTAGDGYPPYNIERLPKTEGEAERLRITLAVAGFSRDEIDVTVEENQLVIRGRQKEEDGKAYLHRGIAARQTQLFERLREHFGHQRRFLTEMLAAETFSRGLNPL